MSDIQAKIAELEAEMARTRKSVVVVADVVVHTTAVEREARGYVLCSNLT